MAQVIINIPDAIAPRLRDSFCIATGYEEQIANPAFDPGQPVDPVLNPMTIPNPVTKMAWIKEKIIGWTKQQAMMAELGAFDQTQRNDRAAAVAQINTDFALS